MTGHQVLRVCQATWPAIGLVHGTFAVLLSSLSSLRLNAVQQKQVAQLPPLVSLCGVKHTVHVVQHALCHLHQLIKC